MCIFKSLGDVPSPRHCLMLSAQDSSSFLDSSPVTRWLWMWQSWRQERKMRDESEIAIILTSPSESQRVHCPGKQGWQGEGARALVWPRYLSSDTAKQTWRKGISLKEFCSMFIQVRSSSISMENIQTLQIKSNSYSKSPSPLRRHYIACLSAVWGQITTYSFRIYWPPSSHCQPSPFVFLENSLLLTIIHG